MSPTSFTSLRGRKSASQGQDKFQGERVAWVSEVAKYELREIKHRAVLSRGETIMFQ